ncbi:hypothetical protein SAY87_005166 [Trapa incisa]|uniref:N-acetyltransferase ESCO acetyl-transferase domain-containing protein n=1 Tax=Trapa incisa TaxID=236973 RepID=A0AAN7K2G0_9MYRT|nr:hypothetical protein SAY87_005166 [Trapa incisa]
MNELEENGGEEDRWTGEIMQPKIVSFKRSVPPEVSEESGDRSVGALGEDGERNRPGVRAQSSQIKGRDWKRLRLLEKYPDQQSTRIRKGVMLSFTWNWVSLIFFSELAEEDEKSHIVFHKNYSLGVPFKGWANERLIPTHSVEVGRIVVVLQSDPSGYRNKVQEVLEMTKGELGSGWIYNELCNSQRIAGCLVAEPIKEAFRAISDSETKTEGPNIREERVKLKFVGLQFGNIEFQREVVKRLPSVATKKCLSGAIYCEEDPIPAVCGVRAIWVSPSHRRKHIATHLLDAVRRSFCKGGVIEHSQLAFSQPTSAGKATLPSV